MVVVGYMSMKKLPVDLFPNITFPIVIVNVPYPGAGPKEVESLISRVLEDEVGTLPGIKSLRSVNKEGLATVIAEFTLETDVKYAEQQIRDRVSSAKRKLPKDIKEPIIRRIDPSDQPIIMISLTADIEEGKLFDLADDVVRPKLEQVNQVGLVEILGARKREIKVELNRKLLKAREISVTAVSNRIAAAGQDVPGGKIENDKTETVIRSVGQFDTIEKIKSTIISFIGNDVPVTVNDVGRVIDSLEDRKSATFVNGKPSILLSVFRQSGANTIAVADAIREKIDKINQDLKQNEGNLRLQVVRDSSKMIRNNVYDVNESILIGIALTIVVVFFFLGNFRSTLITGLALPNSLLGAFLLMSLAGFTINVMSLLALSLAVGLLIDDAIVVRENIFRHAEMGKGPYKASLDGAKEVTLAVVATTMCVLAVFGPIGFLKGVVGQFFKEFGLTVCFAMLISLFDSLTMAPMLSAALFTTEEKDEGKKNFFLRQVDRSLKAFDRFQTWLENLYEKILHYTLRFPLSVIGLAILVFVASLFALQKVPKTFLPTQDYGEFSVALDMPPGTSLVAMTEAAGKIEYRIRENKDVASTVLTVGSKEGESNIASFFVELVPSKQRKVNTSQFKSMVREQLKEFAYANPIVKDVDMVMGGQRPFNLNIIGTDLEELEKFSRQVFERIKDHPGLQQVEFGYKPGKPELQVIPDDQKAQELGVSTVALGQEIRNQYEGALPAVYRENGKEYDIRVRLKDDQRDLKSGFNETYIPNINNALVPLSRIARPVATVGPAAINRQDRGRYIQLSADIAPGGPGMGAAMEDIGKLLESDLKLPPGIRYSYVGQAENFKELASGMAMAALLAVLFVYLVLASLYESFVTPFTIMLVLPLAACGAFFALFIFGKSFDLFSMIGAIMLMGIATKNSILMVDYTKQLTAEGMGEAEAIIKAGKTRLRPIIMTSLALIAGMLPVAIGLNEASKQRTGMGICIIGGVISSTLLTLVVIPAAYSYIERFRVWSGLKINGFIHRKKKKGSHSDNSTEIQLTNQKQPEAQP